MAEPGPLQHAIAQLEAHRIDLGDAAVDAAIEALRRHADTPGSAATASGQRLRQVTVLFADVADSTAMLGRAGTEDAMDLVGRAVQFFADTVQRHGGQVLRFTGDGIKAAFGAQGLREDEAERAVRAGLQILDEAALHARRVSDELGITGFGVRVGIHTGPVLLGGGIEAERTAMGHAVHLAARMEQSAPVGRLRISDATWALVRGLFRAEAQPPLRVKGHDEPLRTWLVLGAEAGPEPSVQRGVEGVAPPMVGRDAELARLVALHARCVATRRGGVAQVSADAGVGKTRLRNELLQVLQLAEGDAGLLQARAQPSTVLQPYGLLRQLLARWLGIRDDLGAQAARERLVHGLAPWLGSTALQQAPRIGQLIGLDFADHPAVQALGASALRAQAFAALRAALRAKASATPLLVVLDDLHWADDASLEFVQSLVTDAAGADADAAAVPLMLLLLARPALSGRSVAPALSTDAASAMTVALTLAPLDDAQGGALVDALLQRLAAPPSSLRALLLERADGNPLYLEALVRMLIDDGVIDAAGRPWQLRADRLAALRVPPTLLGVLQARLDALPPENLLALQQASIVGPVFWDAALAALDPRAPAALPALQARALVVARASSTFADTAEHGFSHALLHDATYGTVLKAQRREGHARAARWLSDRVSDRAAEFLAITAEHYERAGDGAQALEYWDRAQQDAMQRHANTTAMQFIERALAQPALVDTRWRAVLLGQLHEVCVRLSLAPRRAEVIGALAALAESCDDDAMRADVLSTRMLTADREGRPDEALALARQAIEHAERAGDIAAPSAALGHGELAWLALSRRDWATAESEVALGVERARVAAALPRRQGGYAGYEDQLRAIAIQALVEQERHVDALAAVQAASAALGAQARVQDRYSLLMLQVVAERHLGRSADAVRTGREAVAVAEAAGMARLRIPALIELARAHLMRDECETAGSALAMADALGADSGEDFDRPVLCEAQATLALRRGDCAAARAAWLQAQQLYLAQDRAGLAIEPRCRLALLDLVEGRAEAAHAAVQAVLDDAAGDARAQRRALTPAALLACHDVLAALHDAHAGSLREDLHARLHEQLQALPDGAAHDHLLREEPTWRAVAGLPPPAPHAGAPRPAGGAAASPARA